MSKSILYIATSIDGYIARKDGSVDWLDGFDPPGDEDYGYHDFYSRIGTVIMGRKTYEQVVGFGVDWPYAECDTIVITSNPNLRAVTPKTKVVNKNIRSELEKLKKDARKNIWVVGGASLACSLMQFKFIDQLQLFLMPLILGEGISLFPDGTPPSKLHHLKTETFDNGVTSTTFDIAY